jgi:hypothetical protein
MMTNLRSAAGRSSAGDAAVEGLLAGLAAGAAMAVYLTVTALVGGDGLATMFRRMTPDGQGAPLLGLLIHHAISATYGALYGLLTRLLRRHGPVPGLLYGLLLWLLADRFFLPSAGSPLQALLPSHFLVAHLVFGLALGFLTRRA